MTHLELLQVIDNKIAVLKHSITVKEAAGFKVIEIVNMADSVNELEVAKAIIKEILLTEKGIKI